MGYIDIGISKKRLFLLIVAASMFSVDNLDGPHGEEFIFDNPGFKIQYDHI